MRGRCDGTIMDTAGVGSWDDVAGVDGEASVGAGEIQVLMG